MRDVFSRHGRRRRRRWFKIRKVFGTRSESGRHEPSTLRDVVGKESETSCACVIMSKCHHKNDPSEWHK